MLRRIKIISGTGNRPLAEEVCAYLSTQLCATTVGRHSDGEVKIQILDAVRDEDVFIINSTNPPAENLMEMVLLTDAARRSSAGRITQVLPYWGYDRQDRKDKPRVPISAKVVARMLEEPGANRVLVVDPHSETSLGFFDKAVVDHFYGSPIAVEHFRHLLGPQFRVGAPDAGGTIRAKAYTRVLGAPGFIIFDKTRVNGGEVDENSISIVGDVEGMDVLLVDDLIDSAKTIVLDAKAAMRRGARSVYAWATHFIGSGDAVRRIEESPLVEVVVSNTIRHAPEKLTGSTKIRTISIAPLLARAIQCIHSGESVSDLIPK